MTRLLVIGLDSTDPIWLERWLAAGVLPNLARLREQGVYTRLMNRVVHPGGKFPSSATEPSWVMFASGCYPGSTGYWDIVRYDPSTYDYDAEISGRLYDYQSCPPFFELGPKYRVSIFDLPVWGPSPRINGPQVAGWGGHFTAGVSRSEPSDLLDQLNRDFGRCHVLRNDHGFPWQRSYHDWLERELLASVRKRGNIIRHLMKRDPWDLFIGTFVEGHSAGHDLLHYSDGAHPLFEQRTVNGSPHDPMLRVYQALDTEIGEILAAAPDDTTIALFGVHGMGENHSDLLTMAFLPEVLYRWNFPGKAVLASAPLDKPPGPVIRKPAVGSWVRSLWTMREESNPLKRWLRPYLPGSWLRTDPGSELASPFSMDLRRLGWMPAAWYRRLWPRMKAFALPTFWEGRIRINLKDRDGSGNVAPEDYARVCDELSTSLSKLRDARTGAPVVKTVARTRRSPTDADPRLPVADLAVEWVQRAVDAVESPDLGRIGPIPFMRVGGHRPHGFFLAKGPGIGVAQLAEGGEIVDLAPTLLALLGADIPQRLDGRPLISPGGPA